MKKFYKNNSTSIISMGIVAIFMLVIMIILGIEPFGNNSFVISDCLLYIYPIMNTLRNKLLSGRGLLYFWNSAMGDGFLPTYFYSVSSPLNLLAVLIDKYQLRNFINITIAIRIIFSAGTFGFYISRRNKEIENKSYMIPLACAYALSNYITGFYSQSMWLDSYALLPLIMHGYYKMKNENKPAIYIISLALSAYCNFYTTFVIGIFLVLWFILDEHNSVKEFFKKLLSFAVSSLLSIGIAALPLGMSLLSLGNTRITDDISEELSHYWFGNFFNIIKYQYFLAKPIAVSYDDNTANIYCGTFSAILLIMFFLSDKIKISEKVKKGILVVFLLVSMNEYLLNFVWHGFHNQNGAPNRFSFLYVFLVLHLSAKVMDEMPEIKRGIATLAISELLPLVAFVFVRYDTIFDEKTALMIILILIIVYSAFLLGSIISKNKYITYVFSILMIVEILIQSGLALKQNILNLKGYYNTSRAVDEYTASIPESDELTRSVILETNNWNNNMLLDLNGMGTFNGYTNRASATFLKNVGFFANNLKLDDKGNLPPINDALGINTIYSITDRYLSNTDYENVFNTEGLTVYKNQNSLGLGYGIKTDSYDLEFDSYDLIKNINSFTNQLAGSGDIVHEIYPEYELGGEGFNVNYGMTDNLYLILNPQAGVADPYISISFTADRDGFYGMSYDYQNYGTVTIKVNDEIRKRVYLDLSGMLPIGNVKKDDNISIYIEAVNKSNVGLDSSDAQTLDIHMAYIDEEAYGKMKETLSANQMKTERLTDSHLKASVDLSAGQVLYTSIPYDKGWHVYENGKELETKCFDKTFLLLEPGEGHHELEFKYRPVGMIPLIIVSLVSVILFILWVVFNKKH